MEIYYKQKDLYKLRNKYYNFIIQKRKPRIIPKLNKNLSEINLTDDSNCDNI